MGFTKQIQPTIKQLVGDLLEVEADMECAIQDHRRAAEVVQRSQEELQVAAGRITNLGQRRNEILADLGRFRMPEYGGSITNE